MKKYLINKCFINKRTMTTLLILLILSLSLTGCMPGDGSYNIEEPANFLSGIWHGWIAPLSLIRGLFNHNIHVYETLNTGWWYDFGFYIAVVSGFGSLSLTRKRKKKEENK